MVYGGEGRDLKSEFVVAPGADPSRIRVRYAGAGGVRIEEDGALAIPVDGLELREQARSIYQEHSGERVAVEGRFAPEGTMFSWRSSTHLEADWCTAPMGAAWPTTGRTGLRWMETDSPM